MHGIFYNWESLMLIQSTLNFVFKGLYRMNVSESAPIGTSVGIIMAHDKDIGENAEMDYSIENDDSQTFDIITNNETQEGIVILKKVDILKLFALKNNAKSNQKNTIILDRQLVLPY